MKTLSNLDLAQVTGGTSSNSDQVLSSLQGIQSSLSDLGKNQNQQGLFSGQSGMMFMTMATLAMSQRQNNVVVVDAQRGGYWHRRRHCW